MLLSRRNFCYDSIISTSSDNILSVLKREKLVSSRFFFPCLSINFTIYKYSLMLSRSHLVKIVSSPFYLGLPRVPRRLRSTTPCTFARWSQVYLCSRTRLRGKVSRGRWLAAHLHTFSRGRESTDETSSR